jgi:hypothetical protein
MSVVLTCARESGWVLGSTGGESMAAQRPRHAGDLNSLHHRHLRAWPFAKALLKAAVLVTPSAA